MFLGKAGAYPSEAHFWCSTLALSTNIKLSLERLARNKHSSLLQKLVHYCRKKLYKIVQRKKIVKNIENRMNVSIVNALWVLLVGEKLDLNDSKLAKIVQVTIFLHSSSLKSGKSSCLSSIL